MHLTHLEAPLNQRSSRRWLAAFALLNALVMTGITLSHSQWPDTMSGQFYLVLGMLIHFSVLSFVVVLLTISVAFILRAQKYYAPIAVGLFTLAQIIIVTNVKVFSLYHFHINGMVLNLLFSGALLENIAFSWSMWLSVGGILLALVFGQTLLLLLSRKLSQFHRFTNRHHLGFFLTTYIGLQLISGCADAFGWNQITAQNRYIPWMPTTTMRSSLEKMGFEVVENTEGYNLPDTADGLQYPRTALHCKTEQPLNILMLVVDSLRADQFTAEVMPNSFKLRDKALVFDNHYSTSNATRYGLFSMMYGISGSYWKPILAAEKGSVLFDLTLENGYQHFIYGSSTLTFPEFDRTIFSELRAQLQQGNAKSSAENDLDITRRFIADLQHIPSGKPFFGFLFFDAPHGFSIPEEYPHRFEPMLKQVNYLELNNDYDPEPFLNLYKTTAHYVDSLIQTVMDELARTNHLDNTLVIITSDHGQEFNEMGKNFWGHNSNFSVWQTKVPLMLLWPGREATVTTTLSSHEDVIPTLLSEAFGCINPITDYSTGYSLFNLPGNDRGLLMESWTDRAIRHGEYLFLINPLGGVEAVDKNYEPVDDQELPPDVLANTIEQMSRFLKAK
uniref:sulfatase-like hydrolase/transferase n=1 Tax=Cellvibrio fontiphilus TaxID=1815559 RepID=UPI002B4C1A65|nr:sulfatase-like hydrolase/transferase [Cellvibrio fontiphilus]